MTKKALLTFPCQFPIKVIGVASPTLCTEIAAIINQYCTIMEEKTVANFSQRGHYIAITFIINVPSQIILDAIYQAIYQHKNVKMVL